jgi:hypothetical protein
MIFTEDQANQSDQFNLRPILPPQDGHRPSRVFISRL